MYQFIAGFMCGVYLGTRYDLEIYVCAVENKMASLASDLDKRKKTNKEETVVPQQPDVVDEVESNQGLLNRFFSTGKKSP